MQIHFRSLALTILAITLIGCSRTSQPADTPSSAETRDSTFSPATQPLAVTPSPISSPKHPTLVPSGQLSSALTMTTQRAAHTATLLLDGRVLIAGGFRQQGTAEVAISGAELYDPETNTFTPTTGLIEARSGHTATLLPNGKVLIVGGWGVDERSSTAELCYPETGQFSYAADMMGPRASMTASLLPDGRILIAGGDSARNTPQLVTEIYDPAANAFFQTGSLRTGRNAHTATMLDNGRVLLLGGRDGDGAVLASAEIFDPLTGNFAEGGMMRMVRQKHAAVLLEGGDVLVIGGANQDDWDGKYVSAELYEAETGIFRPVADLHGERFKLRDAAVLLENGNVLVGGGNRQVEIFDVQSKLFVAAGTFEDDYFYSVLTLLADGRVLITGGYNASIRPSKNAWIYTY